MLIGDLVIRKLPAEVDEDELAVFLSVTRVLGSIYIKDNSFLTSLSFLTNLVSATYIEISSNPYLIDANLPSLDDITKQRLVVQNNVRLCPEKSPIVMQLSTGSSVPCAQMNLRFSVLTNCFDNVSAVAIKAKIALVLGVNDSQVCMFSMIVLPCCVIIFLFPCRHGWVCWIMYTRSV